jgi:hypothetical protein
VIASGAAVSVFNWAEVLSKVAADGDDPRQKAKSPITLAATIVGGLIVGLVAGITGASDGVWTVMFVGYIAVVVAILAAGTIRHGAPR